MNDDDPISEIPDSAFDYKISSYYDLLQVDRRAAQSEVKQAYRDKIQEYHPDRSDNDYAEEITYALNQAKQILLDQTERVRYNEVGHEQYYTESLTDVNTVSDQFDLEDEDTNTSIYQLIMMTKLNDYTNEPWWKTLFRSTGFKIVLSVVFFLSVVTVAFLLL